MTDQNPNPQNQHGTQQTGRNRCEDCENTFASQDELLLHRRQMHPEPTSQQKRERENVPVE